MNIDFGDLKSQLAPGWSPVNIALMLFCLWFFWPLGLAMIAYIVKGAEFGLDLRSPGSFVPFFKDLADVARDTFNKFKKGGLSGASNTTPGGTPVRDNNRGEQDTLQSDKAALERAAVDAKKRAAEHSDA